MANFAFLRQPISGLRPWRALNQIGPEAAKAVQASRVRTEQSGIADHKLAGESVDRRLKECVETQYLSVAEARKLPGLRLVVTAHMPGPWGPRCSGRVVGAERPVRPEAHSALPGKIAIVIRGAAGYIGEGEYWPSSLYTPWGRAGWRGPPDGAARESPDERWK